MKRAKRKGKMVIQTGWPMATWRKAWQGVPFTMYSEDVLDDLHRLKAVLPMLPTQVKIIDAAITEIKSLRKLQKRPAKLKKKRRA